MKQTKSQNAHSIYRKYITKRDIGFKFLTCFRLLYLISNFHGINFGDWGILIYFAEFSFASQ